MLSLLFFPLHRKAYGVSLEAHPDHPSPELRLQCIVPRNKPVPRQICLVWIRTGDTLYVLLLPFFHCTVSLEAPRDPPSPELRLQRAACLPQQVHLVLLLQQTHVGIKKKKKKKKKQTNKKQKKNFANLTPSVEPCSTTHKDATENTRSARIRQVRGSLGCSSTFSGTMQLFSPGLAAVEQQWPGHPQRISPATREPGRSKA